MQGEKRTLHNVANVGMPSPATRLCKLPMAHSGPPATLFKSQQTIALTSYSRLLLCPSSLPHFWYADSTGSISSAHFIYTSAEGILVSRTLFTHMASQKCPLYFQPTLLQVPFPDWMAVSQNPLPPVPASYLLTLYFPSKGLSMCHSPWHF